MKIKLRIALQTLYDFIITLWGTIKVFVLTKGNWKCANFARQMLWHNHHMLIAAITAPPFAEAEGEFLANIARTWGIERNGMTDEELAQAVLERMHK